LGKIKKKLKFLKLKPARKNHITENSFEYSYFVLYCVLNQLKFIFDIWSHPD